jgi:hypothetical protein
MFLLHSEVSSRITLAIKVKQRLLEPSKLEEEMEEIPFN